MARVSNERYCVRPTVSIDVQQSGRYLFAAREHFIGLRVHSDGIMELKASIHSEPVEISVATLLDMPLESAFRICKKGTCLPSNAVNIADCPCSYEPDVAKSDFTSRPGSVSLDIPHMLADYPGGAAIRLHYARHAHIQIS